MVMMHTMMMDKTRSRDVIKNMAYRDIGDVAVLRRLRVLQLEVLTANGNARMVYPKYVKGYQSMMMSTPP
jgi:hypothetical protein